MSPPGDVTAAVTVADVRAAAARIAGLVVRTPSARSAVLSELFGADVVVKFETFQFTASFKERGAANKLRSMSGEELARGVVAVSAGNHAQAVARHAGLLGVTATIVMPTTTPFVKVRRTEALGARVELAGDDLAGAAARADELVVRDGAVLVHPYDDAAVIAGQGTVALELLEDHPELDTLVVPTGGGGLLAGTAVVAAAHTAGAAPVRAVGVQSARHPAFARALSAGGRDGADGAGTGSAGGAGTGGAGGAGTGSAGGATIADGIAVARPGVLTSALARRAGAEVLVVDEVAIEDAVDLLAEVEKVVTEGAGAAGVAALGAFPERFAGRHVGVVLTGANVDPRLLASILLRGLVRAGRLARLRIAVDDLPGALGRVTSALGAAGGNIVEVTHQRMLLDLPARAAELEVVVETHDGAHRDRLLAALAAAGFAATVIEGT